MDNLQDLIKNPHNFIIGPTDTDSISFCKSDMSPFTKDELEALLKEINDISPEFMDWSHDGYYPTCIAIRAKNYLTVDEKGKMKIKGSALKAPMKEKALKRFLDEIIQLLVDNNQHLVKDIYFKYAREIFNIKDMSDWCSKHTITKAILTGKGTAQVRIREALKKRPMQEGDKIYQFVKTESERCMLEDFDGVYCVNTLLGKLYDTLCIFETILDVKQYPNLTLKKNKELLNGLSGQIRIVS